MPPGGGGDQPDQPSEPPLTEEEEQTEDLPNASPNRVVSVEYNYSSSSIRTRSLKEYLRPLHDNERPANYPWYFVIFYTYQDKFFVYECKMFSGDVIHVLDGVTNAYYMVFSESTPTNSTCITATGQHVKFAYNGKKTVPYDSATEIDGYDLPE